MGRCDALPAGCGVAVLWHGGGGGEDGLPHDHPSESQVCVCVLRCCTLCVAFGTTLRHVLVPSAGTDRSSSCAGLTRHIFDRVLAIKELFVTASHQPMVLPAGCMVVAFLLHCTSFAATVTSAQSDLLRTPYLAPPCSCSHRVDV